MDQGISIGQALTEAREACGMSIESVSEELCISKRYLRALEANEFQDLPEKPFAIGFLRAFADLVDVDSNPLVEQLNYQLTPEEDTGMTPAKPEPVEPLAESSKPGRLLVSVATGLLVSGYLVWSALGTSKQVEDIPPVPEKMMSNASAIAGTAAVKSLAAAVTNSDETVPAIIPQVKLVANMDTWVMIKDAEDKTLVDRIIPSGENYTAPRTKGLRLTTSNAGGLEIFLDGNVMTNLGKQGEFIVGKSFDDLARGSVARHQ